jgi:AsmA protein
MKTLVKWFAILFGAVVGLLLLLSAAVYFLVDIEDYRDEIASAVSNATGRTLTIDGELSLRSFPCCGVSIGQVSLSNAPSFPEGYFAKASEASVSVRVLPLLLRQELQVDELNIDGLDLSLIARRNGEVNWTFTTTDDASPADADSDAGQTLNDLDIGGINISNSRIVYLDEASGDKIELTDVTLSTGSISADAPFDIKADLRALGLLEGVAAQISAASQARVDLDASVLNLEGLSLKAGLSGDDLPAGELSFDGAMQQVNDIGGDVIRFTGLSGDVKTAGVTAEIAGNGEYSDAGFSLTGPLKINSFSPREVFAALGESVPETADSSVLKKVSAQGQLTVAGDMAGLEQLRLTLDDSTITGNLRLASIERESIRFDLNIDALDIDRYLEPEAEGDGSASSAAAPSESEPLPVDTLKALDIDGVLNIGVLKAIGLDMRDANIRVRANQGQLRLKPLTAKLYEGAYSGDVRLNVQQYVPRLSVEENVTGVQIGAFLTDFLEAESSLVGKGNMRFVGNGTGRTTDELIDDITGMLTLNLEEGQYLGMDIWYEVRKVSAGIKGGKAPVVPAAPATPIETMQATARVKRGLQIENDQLDVRIPFMAIKGNGLLDLNAFTLDYKLAGQVTEKPVFDDGTELNNLKGLAMGIGLTGDISDPSVKVDIGSLASSAAKSAIDKEKDKQLNRLLDRLGGKSKQPEAAAGEAAEDAAPATESNATEAGSADAAPEAAKDPKDELKDSLRNLLDF